MNPVIREFAARAEAGANAALFGEMLPAEGAEVLGDVAVRRTPAEAVGLAAFKPLLVAHAAAVAKGSMSGVVGSHGPLDRGTRGTVEVRITTLLHAGGNSTLIY